MDRNLNVLVTCGRFYPSTALMRALHGAGARVDVADPFKLAQGMHTSAADEAHVVTAPSRDPVRFARDVAEIVRRRQIDLVVPAFEEGYFLSRYSELIPAPLFAPPFETILRLHDKSRFLQLCRDLGLRTPKTAVVTSRPDLRDAVGTFDEFVARPAFSRGGQVYLTNHGPRAGETTLDDCTPTEDNPWLVQEYVVGDDACSFSVARDGNVIVHCVYEPSIPAPGGFSVQFVSIEDFGSLDIASRICAELGISGLISFDFRRTAEGAVMIECNPRCTAGVFLSPPDWVGNAVLGKLHDRHMVEAGHRRQYDTYLLDRHMTHLPPRELIQALLSTPDALMSAHDVLPALFSLVNRRHWSNIAKGEHISVGRAFVEDVAWNGSPMPDLPPT